MIHENLERRFLRLAAAETGLQLAQSAFALRYKILFDALAEDLGISREQLAGKVGFGPVPKGGNKIMNGEKDPSILDCHRLLEVYMDTRKKPLAVSGRLDGSRS